MEKYTTEQLPQLFEGAAVLFLEKKRSCVKWTPAWATVIWD